MSSDIRDLRRGDIQIYERAGDKLIMRMSQVSSTLSYVGYALPGTATNEAKWRIQRTRVIGTETELLFANKTDSFEHVWDDKETYTTWG